MMARVLHVTSGLGLRKFQADGFLLTRVYVLRSRHALAQLAEALRSKPEGRKFDSRWCHRNFSLT